MSVTLVTPYFRVSFPNVFKPRAFGEQEPKFSVVALFPKGTDLTPLREAAKKVCAEEWGDNPKKWPQLKHNPFRKHEEKAEKDEEGNPKKDASGKLVLPQGMEEGGIFMTFTNKERPGLVDQNKQDILEASEFYAGCWARAHVNVSAYDNKFGKGISFYLNHLQKVKEGDPLGNRTRVEDAFTPIAGAEGGQVETANDLFA